MPEYQVIARKYRPQCFCDTIGQEPTTTTLKNAIKYKRLAHAYLFCGPRGTGKTSIARIFAKAINCQDPTQDREPCNTQLRKIFTRKFGNAVRESTTVRRKRIIRTASVHSSKPPDRDLGPCPSPSPVDEEVEIASFHPTSHFSSGQVASIPRHVDARLRRSTVRNVHPSRNVASIPVQGRNPGELGQGRRRNRLRRMSTRWIDRSWRV